MLRTTMLALALALSACHHDPQPVHAESGELPPLPPASGTPIGYLIDSADTLKLRDDQIAKLKDIDASLAARDASIDTQLRQIERPADEEEPQQKQEGPKRRRNNAPGMNTLTNADAGKLHDMRNANDREALKKAFAVLDPAQQATAKKILEERGIELGAPAKKQEGTGTDDGTPLPPGEP
jgi:hypothetical protein